MQKVVLATGNAGKVRELASLLSDFGLDIVAQTDLGVDSAEETGLTFIENAILKARHAAKVTGLPAIADDSGLAVDVLGGAPGIYSARYSGEDATDLKNLQKLLETLKDVPDDQRQARFHCVLVYLRHAEDPTPLVCHGSWPGVITREPAGTGGFGYDPIFFVPSEGKTAAELTREEKSALDSPHNLIMSRGAAKIQYTYYDKGEKTGECLLDRTTEDKLLKNLISENRLLSIHSSEPTLNDIFVDITGRTLQ